MKEFLFAPPMLTLLSIWGYFAQWYMGDPAISLLSHYMGIMGLMCLWIFIPVLFLKWKNGRSQDQATSRYACVAAFLQTCFYLLWLVGLAKGYAIAA